jgi:hypothetical protein
MAGSYTNYKIKKFLIISHDEQTVINMTETQASVQYFEDLFSPAIFLRLVVVDTQGLLTSLPSTDSKIKPGLKGGEQVILTIEQTETKQVIDINETTNPYYIYKISGSTTQSTKEMFVIDIAPLEVFSNETTRVFRRYPESSGSKQTIDQSVEQILTGVLKTTKKRNIDATKNSYHFFGNSKKPFTVLTWLGPKSIPPGKSSTNSGTAGFLFYENTKGYNFRSLDSLFETLSPTGSSTPVATYRYDEKVNAPADPNSNFKIVSTPFFEKNVNVLENMRIGMYSSVNYFYDANTRDLKLEEYKLSESLDVMKNSAANPEKPKVPKYLEDSPSRIMVKVIDQLVGEPDNSDETEGIDQRPLYQSQSIARYNLAFSQLLNITVPLNLNLTVGDVIKLDFGNITLDESKKGLRDDLKSGNYLIKELSHLFETNQGYTGLKLIRDSYGVPPK